MRIKNIEDVQKIFSFKDILNFKSNAVRTLLMEELLKKRSKYDKWVAEHEPILLD